MATDLVLFNWSFSSAFCSFKSWTVKNIATFLEQQTKSSLLFGPPVPEHRLKKFPTIWLVDYQLQPEVLYSSIFGPRQLIFEALLSSGTHYHKEDVHRVFILTRVPRFVDIINHAYMDGSARGNWKVASEFRLITSRESTPSKQAWILQLEKNYYR